MTVYAGKEGVVKIAGSPATEISIVTEFEVETTAGEARIDGLNEDWEDVIATKKKWTGSLSCMRNDADTAGQGALLAGAVIALELYPDGDGVGRRKLSGLALITSRTDGASNDAANTISISFTGKGELVRAAVSA